MASDTFQSGGCKPAADIFSLGISAFELVWNVVLPTEGEVWQHLRNNTFPAIDPSLKRSPELIALVKRVRAVAVLHAAGVPVCADHVVNA